MVRIPVKPDDLLEMMKRDVNRSLLSAKNGVKVVTGIGGTPSGTTPKDVVWSFGNAELWRYRSEQRKFRTPLLVVHSLVTRSYVFDLSPGNSFVEFMLDRGFDVFLLDWGEPDERSAHYDLSTYSRELLPEVVRATATAAGEKDVVMLGYCLGGLLSLLYAAANPDDPLRSLAVMATPLHFEHMGVIGKLLSGGRIAPESILDHTGNVPPDVVRDAFRMMQPAVEITGYANLWQHLWNDDFVAGFQTMTRWGTDHIPLSGAVVADLVRVIRSGDLDAGRPVLGGRRVDLADIQVPFLAITADKDHLVPTAASGDPAAMVGSADRTRLPLRAGHVGVFLGRSAQKHCLPAIAEWCQNHMEVR